VACQPSFFCHFASRIPDANYSLCCARPQVINNVASYPTMTDFVISTNAPEQLESWRRTNTLGATAFRVHAAVNTVGAYGLTWAHRDVVEDSLANGAQFAGGFRNALWPQARNNVHVATVRQHTTFEQRRLQRH